MRYNFYLILKTLTLFRTVHNCVLQAQLSDTCKDGNLAVSLGFYHTQPNTLSGLQELPGIFPWILREVILSHYAMSVGMGKLSFTTLHISRKSVKTQVSYFL